MAATLHPRRSRLPRRSSRSRSSRRGGARRSLRSFLTAARWHQRLLAAGLVAAATAAGLAAVAPPQVPTVPVVVAAHDLAAGAVPAVDDLRVARLPAGSAPAHAYAGPTAVPGRELLAPKRAGTPLTDLDFLDAASLARLGNHLVAAPVRIADAASLRYVRVGDRIDVLGAATVPGPGVSVGRARTVAAGVRVIAVSGSADGSGLADASGDGGLVVLAVAPATARALAGAAVTSELSLALRPSR